MNPSQGGDAAKHSRSVATRSCTRHAGGGTAAPVELTARDREICAAIGPTLKARGLIFVGIDVIGDYLTEINVTSPTGAQQLKAFTGVDATALMWDVVERKRAG